MRFARRVFLLMMAAVTVGAIAAAGGGGTAHSAVGGTDISQVKHVVVLMEENRSADHYLGQLSAKGQSGFEAEPTTGNPDPLSPGKTIVPFHTAKLCETSDLSHSWNASHQEWDNGAMDGFTAANDSSSENSNPLDPNGSRTMGYYDDRELPFYYSLYNTFATGDRYFASVLSQTYPNRFYLLAGTSFGHIANDNPPAGGWPQKTVFDLLGAANVSWKVYYAQFPFAGLFSYVQQHEAGHVEPISQYYEDAKNGTLPEVAFVDPIFLGDQNTENDEHPPANVQVGQRFAYDAITALEQSPNWDSSAFFLTYDEHGGFYDHVAPPPAAAPDNIAPMVSPGDAPGGFDRYGIRVPVAVVSPFAKAHFVSHVVHDHTSILRFIETRFGLPSLTARDAAADPMLEFFDFANPPFLTPPSFTKPSVTNCATSTSTTTTTTPGGAPTITVTPTSGLVDGATVTVGGSGFADGPGAVLECNYTPNEPTVKVVGNDIPVGCTNPLTTLVNFSGGRISGQTFTVHTGVIGPSAAGTDSAGNDAAADAALYPCPPTPAQKALGATCVVALGDAGGHQARQTVRFQGEVEPTTTTAPPSTTTSTPVTSGPITTTTTQAALAAAEGATTTTTSGAHVLAAQTSRLSFTGMDAERWLEFGFSLFALGSLVVLSERKTRRARR